MLHTTPLFEDYTIPRHPLSTQGLAWHIAVHVQVYTLLPFHVSTYSAPEYVWCLTCAGAGWPGHLHPHPAG